MNICDLQNPLIINIVWMVKNSGNFAIPKINVIQFSLHLLNVILYSKNTRIINTFNLWEANIGLGAPRAPSGPCAPHSAVTSTISSYYRPVTLLWIPFSSAARQTVNKIHCIFAPLSSSVFWHIQMPSLKRVNNENNVFSSRHSKKGITKASEDAAGKRHHANSCVYSV